MDRIKVLLAVRPRMLAEVIRNMVEHQPDMQVVSEALDPVELLLAAAATPADVAIVAQLSPGRQPEICGHLLAEHPDLTVVSLAGKGDAAFVYATGRPRRRIDELDESSILQAMRAPFGPRQADI